MGVKGLETFLDKTEAASKPVALEDLANEYKRDHNEPPVIVIDSMSILRFLYGDLSWLNGGQLKEFREKVQYFIQKFVNLGYHLVFFMDGPMQEIKLSEWRNRRYEAARNIACCIDLVNEANKTTEQIEQKIQETLFLPNGMGAVFNITVAQAENCKLIKSVSECDEEVACYARKHKCLAILGQDTDYVIYNCAGHYLSMKKFNLEKMTTVSYSGTSLARHLGLEMHEMPLLASLSGNDFISYETIKHFTSYLYRSERNQRYKNFYNREDIRNHKIYKISEYIKKNRGKSLYDISINIFGNRNYELLKKSVESYSVSSAKEFPERYNSPDENWRNILIKVKELHLNSFWPSQLYDIVILSRFTSSTCLEDYRTGSPFEPSAKVLKELRRISYGILLHEKPSSSNESNCINEFVMGGMDSLEDYKKVFPKYLKKTVHPGLLTLWNCKDDKTEEMKWDILCEVFDLPKTALKKLPPRLIIPTLCVKYLKGQTKIDDWEINAILSCAICVPDYSTSDLSQLPSECINYRSVWLYNVLTRAYSLILNLIFYLGQLFSWHQILVCEYSDGKLFHKKYNMGEKSPQISIDSLCEHKVEHIESFNFIKDLLNN